MALVTAAEVRARGLKVASSTLDTEIGYVIDSAERWIASYIGLPAYDSSLSASWEDQTYTLYLDGEGGVTLQLPVRPIVSITSIHVDEGRQYASSSEVTSGDYDLDEARGQVTLDWDSSTRATWPDGRPRSIKVVMVAGWATVPEWLKQTVSDIVVAQWKGRQGATGKQSKSGRGGAVTFREDLIPLSAYQALQEYRPPPVG